MVRVWVEVIFRVGMRVWVSVVVGVTVGTLNQSNKQTLQLGLR